MNFVNTNLIIIAIYVDDLLVTRSDDKLIHRFKVEMLKVFEMKNIGLINFLLGMEVKHDHGGIFICQHKYARKILKSLI
uniref:Reverse transcriptase Ty1/copia-type domain-containing protein n=1 Tax=Cajanus cajan TaxID=3821 RepID=A0A151RYA1_CAJCA|nr:hypothetical protein KK1_030957 [Cajanus cajan]